jgi:hypothetical protein
MSETELAGQQTAEGTQGTTGAEFEGANGQSAATNQTTSDGTGTEATFFDPNGLAPELLDQYKEMQRAFTKKTTAYSKDKHKVEAYNAFERDPLGTMAQLARQYGYSVIQGQQQQADGKPWEPQNWDEVTSRIKTEARNELLHELQPLLSEVKNLKERSTEQYMDANYPDWRKYEEDMRDLMTKHPTLAKDPDILYRMALPAGVIESRATKKALNKLQADTKGAQISGQGTVNKPTSKTPDGPLSFNQAVEEAKRRIASR